MPSNPTWTVGPRRRPPAPSSDACKRLGFRIALYVCVCGAIAMAAFLAGRAFPAPSTSTSSTGSALSDLEEFVQRAHAPAPARKTEGRLRSRDMRARRIVLSDGEGKWNTGVWPGWGEDPVRTVLKWAASGVVVEKACPFSCVFTRDQSLTSSADAVVMELVNHPKFGYSKQVSIPWPTKRPNPRAASGRGAPTHIPRSVPLTGIFYYEAATSYPEYTLLSRDIRDRVDFSVTPSRASSVPITMLCPWGRGVDAFVSGHALARKLPGRFLAYFNEHGVASSYRVFIDELFALAGDNLHAYLHRRNRDLPPEAGGNPYSLSARLDFMGTYKFVLVTEAVVEEDWVEPDLSHVFVAGAVPIYIGAHNVHAYIPGPRSFIHARDFSTAKELWKFLQYFQGDSPEAEERYRDFFAWQEPARKAYQEDENSDAPSELGTGAGLSTKLLDPDTLTEELRDWDAKPDPRSAAFVPSLTEVTKWQRGQRSFDDVAAYTWRNFRRQLDRCVHYAECRICELVTVLT